MSYSNNDLYSFYDLKYGKDNDNYSFSFETTGITINHIDFAGTIKSTIITGSTTDGIIEVFEVLPTTQLRVYTKKDVDQNGFVVNRDSYFFTHRYPEELQKKITKDEPCCDHSLDYYENGDFLITKEGKLIEVIDVNLNYCSPKLFYNLSVDDSITNIQVFNGNQNYEILMRVPNNGWDPLSMGIQQYYTGITCCTDIPTIESLTRNYTERCSEKPTPTPTPTPTPSGPSPNCSDCAGATCTPR